jgi:outer membrane immunogenic protein
MRGIVAMKNMFALAILPALIFMAGAVSAQSSTPLWDGFYLGASVGGENTKACSSSALTGMNIAAATSTLTRCGSGGLVGGLQFGDNFQIKRLVFGIGADVIISEAKSDNSTLQFVGAAPPPGTYSLSGRLSPKDFAIIGGRIGYGGNLVFPYVRAGAVITTGSQSSTLAYVPAGTTTPVASFDGGKNFNSTGWAAGAGAEIGLNGAWSLSAEYLHMSLGNGSNSATTCAGPASACSAFAGVALDTTHGSFTANLFRVGINYWFNYWDKP